MRPVYQRVTNDKFRLVLAQEDTPSELARITGVKLCTISHALKKVKTGERKSSCWQVTWINEDEEDE
jgi:DNA-binding transcriptional ArsR family regulator